MLYKKIADLYPHIEIIGKYTNMSTDVNCYCKKHDVYWITTPQKILNGHECVECGKEKLSKYHTLSQKEFENMVTLSNPNIDVISNYKGIKYDITVKCKNVEMFGF